ncbi:MAG: RNA polymerase sigma-70 factor, ECF subfamily [Acidimicrobiaceae bacterium]|nr:MAG: RNA polymerase sigma-70 factor, ECF subfamily [Acidimicrobiaceae bacterium]
MDDVDETPDSVLAARARTGDAAAFGALVVRHQPAAIRLATIVGGSLDDAADIVQEAFVKAYRALPQQRDLVSATPLDPEAVALATTDAQLLIAALARLGERDRQVIGFRYFAGLTEAETATALDAAAGTVKSRTARALARLRQELDRSGVRGD